MRETLIGTDAPGAWAAALEGVPHGFDHTWAACHAAELDTGWPTWLYCAEQAGVRVVCPFAERRHGSALDLVTPRGFSGFSASGAWPGFAARWQAFAAARGAVCGYIAQHPEFGAAELEGPAEAGPTLYLLDLAAGAAATLARARKGRRRELRAWRARGHRYVDDPAALRDFALGHHAGFMTRVGAAAASRRGDAALRTLIAAPGSLFVGASRDGGAVEAVLLVGATRWGAEGVFNIAALPGGREHTVALLAWCVEALAAQGVPWLNLGGGVRDGDAIAAAKREWNPREARLRRLKHVYRPDEYARLCAQVGVDPASRDGYFPAYYRPAGP